MRIAPKGQRTAHFAQPVQPPVSSSTERFFQSTTCSDSTCGGQTAMHQPQPVQRAGSIRGRAIGTGRAV